MSLLKTAIVATVRKRLPPKQRWELLLRDGFTCQLCMQPLPQLTPGRFLYQIDHIKPLFLSGKNDVKFLRCLHDGCHAWKTAIERDPQLWERLSGKSKYFHGPLCITTEQVFGYFEEMKKMRQRFLAASLVSE